VGAAAIDVGALAHSSLSSRRGPGGRVVLHGRSLVAAGGAVAARGQCPSAGPDSADAGHPSDRFTT